MFSSAKDEMRLEEQAVRHDEEDENEDESITVGNGEEEEEEMDENEDLESKDEDSGRLIYRTRSFRTRESSSLGRENDTTRIKKRKSKRDGCNERRNRRRTIAKVITDANLDDNTRKAREAEAKRAQKIDIILGKFAALSDKQLVVVPCKKTEKKVCLNLMAGEVPTGEEGVDNAPIYVFEDLVEKLKPHQIDGARFLWSHVAVEPVGFGCVLADFMGLGKTLQVITTTQAFLSMTRMNEKGKLKQRHKHVLILAPTICVRNWEAEVVKWLGKKETRRLGLFTLESSREKTMGDRVSVIKNWYKRGGILIMGYELYRLLVLQSSGEEKIAAGNQKYAHLIKQVYACLSNPGPDLIVLDEGHRVRSHKSKMVKALAHVKTTRRIILTGYPLQNHLEEYWTMVNFARPDYLGSLDEFKNRYVAPITNGQCIDSCEADLRLARHRAFVLTRELRPLVLRRDQQYLFKQLPPKKEYVLMCKLTDAQAQLYREFLKHGVPTRGDSDQVDILGGYHIAQAISNHPDVVCETYKRLEKEKQHGCRKKSKCDDVLDIFEIEDGENNLYSYDSGPRQVASRSSTLKATSSAETRGLRNPNDDDGDNDDDADDVEDGDAFITLIARSNAAAKPKPTPAARSHRLKFAQHFIENYVPSQIESSGKMMILLELLSACQSIGDRVIVFSQSIPTLNVIGATISKHNKLQRCHEKRFNYLRIDGSTPQPDRFRQIAQFNDLEEDIDLILISTKAGGEGINLCAGNRIIIFDVCWNPCNDSQSMCRSYRFGQTKPVFVYRFVTMGTMEKKVYDLQIRKEGVAKRIVDDKTTERKFMSSELQTYFSIEDFENSLLHAQGKAVNDEDVVVQATPHEDFVLMNILTDMQNKATATAATISNESGEVDGAGVLADRRCIIDWFEQETMFEEDLDQKCTPAEQKEILESYTYFKAVRTLRNGGTHLISRADVLMRNCDICRAPNEIYPTSITNVPLPLIVECIYCKRSMATAGAVPLSQITASAHSFMGCVPWVPTTAQGAEASTVALPSAVASSVAFAPPTLGSAPSLLGPMRSRILPPHLQIMFDQQKRKDEATEDERAQLLAQQNAEQNRLLLERKQAMIAAAARKQERSMMRLSDRHLLILRRGIKGCQDLKRKAVECGALLAIEVNSQLTDIVSAMSPAETCKWLRLSKLPGDVELHDDNWLWNEIAKEQEVSIKTVKPSMNQSLALQRANTSPPAVKPRASVATSPGPMSTSAYDQSPQTTLDSSSDCIELLGSDDDGPPKTCTSIEPAAGGNCSAHNATGMDATDVIEIL